MREGRPFCLTFFKPLKFGVSVFLRATNTLPNNNSLVFVAVCGEEMSLGVLFGYTIFIGLKHAPSL